jgi:hypothetical protein
MQLDAQTSSSGGGALTVRVPPTRSDILHPCDVMEDVAIAHGYNNLTQQVRLWLIDCVWVEGEVTCGCLIAVLVGLWCRDCTVVGVAPSTELAVTFETINPLSLSPDPVGVHAGPRAPPEPADGAAAGRGGDGGVYRGAHMVRGHTARASKVEHLRLKT